MGRVLLLVALVLLVAYLLDSGLGRLRGRLGELLGVTPAASGAADGRSADELVACATCGVHVLRSRALPAPSRRGAGKPDHYCSETCRSRAESAA